MYKNDLDRFTAGVDGNGFSALPGLGDGYGFGRACGGTACNGIGEGLGKGMQWWSSLPSSSHGSGVASGRGFDDFVGGNRYPVWLRRRHK